MLLMGLTHLAALHVFPNLKNFKIGLILLLNKVIVKISDLYDMLPNFVSSFCKGKVQLYRETTTSSGNQPELLSPFLSNSYALLINPNEDKTAVHGCHCSGYYTGVTVLLHKVYEHLS